MQRTWLSILAATSLVLACSDDTSGDSGSTDGSSGSSTDGPPVTTSTTGASTSTEATATQTTDVATDDSTTSDGIADSSSTTGAPTCPDVGEPCTQCEARMCPQEYCDCYDNGSCVLLAQCTLQCDIDDIACNQACWTQYPEGISDGALLTHCAATVCMPQCGPFVALTECQECLYARCPDEMNVCISNPDCTALLACLDACEDPGCENGCYALYPDGLADSGPVGECAQDACTDACV